jgi:hypothetical protein
MLPHFVGWLKGRCAASQPRRFTYRPRLDWLEDRLAPATLYKIVPSVGAGSLNSFTTLSQALAVAKDGDHIMVEPGANPGSATVFQNNLVLQGDPAAGYLGLQTNGTQIPSLVLFGNGNVVANLCVGSLTIGAGVTGENITGCLFNGTGIVQTPGTPTSFQTDGNNSVLGCTFVNGADVRMGSMGGSTFATAANDTISNNVFWNPTFNAIIVQNETGGLVVSNNRINHTDPNSGTIFIMAIDCVGTISGNVINGTAATGAVGILIKDFNVVDPQTTNLTVTNNVITTNQTGIEIQRFASTNTFAVALTNNTLASNQVGLVLTGNSAGNGADYGSLTITANDFRGYSGANGSFAILTTDNAFYPATAPTKSNVLTLQSNIFSAANPQTVISTSNSPGTTFNLTTLLSTGQYNLMAMFQALGGGPPTAAQFTSMTAAGPVVQALGAVTSSQAAKTFVDGLYVTLLGRMPGNGEDLGWITNLTVGGMTDEQAIVLFVTSGEYYGKVTQGSANPNAAWIQSLYTNLLGRQAGGAEINGWMSAVPTLGLGGIAQAFVSSAEFRIYQVNAMYGAGSMGVIFAPNLLKRRVVPSLTEVAGWTAPGLDLRAIEVQLLAGLEFALDG